MLQDINAPLSEKTRQRTGRAMTIFPFEAPFE
jgi:hypothetical protein